MEKHKFIVPYQYTVIAHAEIWAESLEAAVELVQDAPCPTPEDVTKDDYTDEIHVVEFSYLQDSFEVHEEDLDIYNN